MAEQAISAQKISPLDGLPPLAGGATLSAVAQLAKVILRARVDDEAAFQAAASALGVALPQAPNTVRLDATYRVFWLGPSEWLIHGEEGRQAEIVATLEAALDKLHTAVIDVSDYYTVMRLSGPRAQTLLNKGTPLDLHPRVFAVGDCAQTRFGHASVLLHHLDEGPTFDIQVRWSYAAYVWTYLIEGAREYAGE